VLATGMTFARSLATRAADVVNVKDFGAVGDGVEDDTDEIQAAFLYCRTNKVKVFIPAGTYLISSQLDISGLDIEGVLKGYRNNSGTIIKGSGGHAILTQLQTNLSNITYSIKNIRIENGSVGLIMTYSVNCVIENVYIVNCVDGIYCGVNGILGPLWNNFKNCQVAVSNIGLSIHGNDFANANIFDTCFFDGDNLAISINCTGGIGAVANYFLNTEIKGEGRGANLFRAKSTIFDNCYFESFGPAIVVESFSIDSILNGCVFGSLKNTNPDSPSFIYHKSGNCNITINGGYIFLNAGAVYDNLYLVASDVPSSFSFEMLNAPKREINSTNFQTFFSGLPTASNNLIFSSSYTPAWTTTGTAPVIGNGSLTGRYSLSGNICTVQFQLVAGSTTTFGTGQFQITLPFPTVNTGQRAQGMARIFDSGVGQYVGLIEVISNSSLMVFYPTTSVTDLVSSTSPMTWASGDSLRGTITYQIA